MKINLQELSWQTYFLLTRTTLSVSRIIQVYFMGFSSKFQGGLKRVGRVFQGRGFQSVLKVFQGRKKIFNVFQINFMLHVTASQAESGLVLITSSAGSATLGDTR